MKISYPSTCSAGSGDSACLSAIPVASSLTLGDFTIVVTSDNETKIAPISVLGAFAAIAPGDGSPEAVVTAGPGALYWDSTNKILYVKETGVSNTGWASI